MKKILSATITSAILIGTASTSFAATNPFSDVPSDHWSVVAVSQLAQEGIIEGYGDKTFHGDAHITRYEMAQMVAKAMAKDLTGADKQMIEKLSAEYSNELTNLGVRVAQLDKQSDNVMIEGVMRIEGKNTKITENGLNDKEHSVTGLIRLDMTAAVNENWTAKARLDATTDLKNGDTSIEDEKVKATRIYAEGPLLGATAKLGRYGGFDSEGLTTGGIIIDTEVTGAEFTWHNDAFTTKATVARIGSDDYQYADLAGIGSSDYQALQVEYAANDKFKVAAGYHNIHNNAGFAGSNENNGIFTLGVDYKLASDLTLGALYAKSNLDLPSIIDNQDKAYTAQLTYKGAESDIEHSYGIWAAYRYIGGAASIAPTYDGANYGEKGIEAGIDYMLDKNILLKGVYFDGKNINGNADVKRVFGQLEFQF